VAEEVLAYVGNRDETKVEFNPKEHGVRINEAARIRKCIIPTFPGLRTRDGSAYTPAHNHDTPFAPYR